VFKREAKRLLRKYPPLNKDLSKLQIELLANPELGTPLGNRTFKIRLSIRSKGKGKSGGARVITYLETEIISTIEIEKTTIVTLVSIYDKSEVSTITPKELRELIKKMAFE
jgi:hypothetical protein